MDKSSERLNSEAPGNTNNHRESVLKKLSTMGLGSANNTETNEKINHDVTDKENGFVKCITNRVKKLVYHCDNQKKEQNVDCQSLACASTDPCIVDGNENCYSDISDKHLRNPMDKTNRALRDEHITPPITLPVSPVVTSPNDLNVCRSDTDMADNSENATENYLDTIHTSPISDCEAVKSDLEEKSRLPRTSQFENTDTEIHKCSSEEREQTPVTTTDNEHESSEDPLRGLFNHNSNIDRLESIPCTDKEHKDTNPEFSQPSCSEHPQTGPKEFSDSDGKYCSQQSPKNSDQKKKSQTVSSKCSGGNDGGGETLSKQSLKLSSATVSATGEQSSFSSSHKHNLYMVDSEETVENDSDDDDDLLSPPQFLYASSLSSPNVTTPKKGYAPASASPLTPLTSPSRPDHKSHRGKYKLSLDKLLSEKNKKQKKNEKLARMEADLQEGLSKGGVLQMVAEDSGEDDEDDDGKDLSECTLPAELKKYIIPVHSFNEELPGENIFPDFPPNSDEYDMTVLVSVDGEPNANGIEKLLMTSSSTHLRELLCGGWITNHYLMKPCPQPVAEWLFDVMCHHWDIHVSSCAYQALWALLLAGTEEKANVPKGSRGMTWVPSVDLIVKFLNENGASIDSLFPLQYDGLKIPLKHSEEENVSEGKNENKDTGASSKADLSCTSFPVWNFSKLVNLCTHCLQNSPLSYTEQDLKQLMVIVCRLSLDLRLQSILFDIEMCIAAILQCFGSTQWPDEIKEFCQIVVRLSTNHRNLLHLVQIQPLTEHGVEFRRRLSLMLLRRLVDQFLTGVGKEEPCSSEESSDWKPFSADVPDSVKISELVVLMDKIRPHDKCDYFMLHTIITLLDLAVGNEDLPSSDMGELERLIHKLRSLNGDIRDPRAAFMDRTKVKDLLVRTMNKLTFLLQSTKPPKERMIASYFGSEDTDDMEIQTLRERSDTEEEEDAMTEEMEVDSEGEDEDKIPEEQDLESISTSDETKESVSDDDGPNFPCSPGLS